MTQQIKIMIIAGSVFALAVTVLTVFNTLNNRKLKIFLNTSSDKMSEAYDDLNDASTEFAKQVKEQNESLESEKQKVEQAAKEMFENLEIQKKKFADATDDVYNMIKTNTVLKKPKNEPELRMK